MLIVLKQTTLATDDQNVIAWGDIDGDSGQSPAFDVSFSNQPFVSDTGIAMSLGIGAA